MQFELMRFSMMPREQIDGFERESPDGEAWTREKWLRIILSETFEFLHRKTLFHYVHSPSDHDPENRLIIGKIGRSHQVQEHAPPEDGLEEIQRKQWQAARLFVDPRHHKDGQKVAMEADGAVGLPVPIVDSLVEHINRRPEEPYILQAHAIIEEQSFWEFADEHDGEITFVGFELAVPNMFDETENYDKELAKIREEEKASKVKFSIENKDGLKVRTKRVKNAVDYAARGTGTIRARTKRKKTYDSSRKAKRVKVEAESNTVKGVILSVVEAIFGQ